MLKDAEWITEQYGMIDPFVDHKVITNEVMSYGLKPYGYTFRVSGLWRPVNKRKREDAILDPKKLDKELFVDFRGPYFDLYPGSSVLVKSVEQFRIPEDIIAFGYGKAAYQNLGVIPNIAPLEPEWEGFLSFSISNTQKVPVRLYAEEGIAHLVFFDIY